MFGVNVVIADTPAKSPLANWASLYCASVSNGWPPARAMVSTGMNGRRLSLPVSGNSV